MRLEELAARALPRLNISTSAFGRTATGQINQLPLYDAYARSLRPKLVVLVFARNDFRDNHRLLAGIFKGWDPDQAPYVVAEKSATGAITLRPPDPAWRMLPVPSAPPEEGSRVLRWLRRATGPVPGLELKYTQPTRLRAKLLAQDPRYQSVIDVYLSRVPESLPAEGPRLLRSLEDPTLPLFREAVEFTAFALDGFQRRVAADGASLWLLLVSSEKFGLGDASDPFRVIVEDLAEARGIPVVSMRDYIVRQSRNPREGNFPLDSHWNSTGHQWAAETLLERLRQRPEVCGV